MFDGRGGSVDTVAATAGAGSRALAGRARARLHAAGEAASGRWGSEGTGWQDEDGRASFGGDRHARVRLGRRRAQTSTKGFRGGLLCFWKSPAKWAGHGWPVGRARHGHHGAGRRACVGELAWQTPGRRSGAQVATMHGVGGGTEALRALYVAGRGAQQQASRDRVTGRRCGVVRAARWRACRCVPGSSILPARRTSISQTAQWARLS